MRALLFIIAASLFSCTRYNGSGVHSGASLSGSDDAVSNNTASAKLPPGEYVRWVQDKENGLKKEKTIENIIFTAQYKPCDYVICEEEQKNSIADSTIKKKRSELEGMQYYNLRIELKDGQGE